MMTPACVSKRAWITLLVVTLLAFSADLITKKLAFAHVAAQPVQLERETLLLNSQWSPIPIDAHRVVIPGRILDFQLVLNDGAVFGIGSQKRIFFIIFTIIALGVATFIFAKQTGMKDYHAHVALGLILGGGLGNLYDRIFIGRVRDFLYLFPDRHLPFGLSWPGGNNEWFPWIFNIGDSVLLVGMGILMIYFWKQPNPVTSNPPDEAK